ncbi:MAG: DUF3488 and transglutaminase-like domain-containing protein [Candidatus Dormibacteria bacterium]
MAVMEPPEKVAEFPVPGSVEGLDPTVEGAELPPDEEVDLDENPLRHTIAVLCPTVAAAVIVGGIFNGLSPRGYAILAAVLGGLVAYGAQRARNPVFTNLLVIGGLVVIGILPALAVGGFGAAGQLGNLIGHATAQAHVVRPPITLTAGFAALLGWIMAAVGFSAVWAAIVLRAPAIGMLLPLPVAAVAAISLPKGEQVIDGLILVGLFGIGLGVLSGDRSATGEAGLPIGYEVRRAAKAVPVLAGVVIAIFFLAQTHVLFPHPVVDPTLQAQRPRTAPLSSVTDKVLFDVNSSVTGPWIMGVLDVYNGKDWLLPSFNDSRLKDIPSSGVVDGSMKPAVQATFTIQGLGGAVLPGLPNTVGIEASGPRLNYDTHSGNIRLVEGEVPGSFTYKVAAAGVPDVSSLQEIKTFPDSYKQFIKMPPMPPAVKSLIDGAPQSSPWDKFDYLRQYVLKNVVAAGLGTPVSIPPDRVQTVLGQTKEASPYEIVAMQVMLARWAGVPARIGYGFDGGTKVGDHLEVHPRDGAAFPEVYFPGHGWLPVIGTPAKAKASETSDPRFQQFTPGVLPSKDISVPVFLPAVVPGESDFLDQLRAGVLVVGAVVLALALLYVTFPALLKAIIKARRRAVARSAGGRARIVQAYAEWRDALIDLGYRYPSDTPIMLLDRFPNDEEHSELAWLVTRALWGDLQAEVGDDLAADAEELSRALRRRLLGAQPITVRAVAAVSKLSLRHPYHESELKAAQRRKRDAA